MAGRSLWPARRSTRLSGRNFCSLIVQQMKGSLAEGFKCKLSDLTAKLFLHLIVQPEENLPRLLNDLNANDTGCALPRLEPFPRPKDNGIDPELFINSLGGEPSFSDCESTAKQSTHKYM